MYKFSNLTLYHKFPTFKDPKEEGFRNTVGKGENAGNEHFHLLSQFSSLSKREIVILTTLRNVQTECQN